MQCPIFYLLLAARLRVRGSMAGVVGMTHEPKQLKSNISVISLSHDYWNMYILLYFVRNLTYTV
jgi:hypothetical protein